MSTILEALRKLQAEREQPKQQQELRTSLVQANYTPRPIAPSRRIGPVGLGIASGVAVLAVAVGALSLWPDAEQTSDPLERAASVTPPPRTEPAPPAFPPPPGPMARAYPAPPAVEPAPPREPVSPEPDSAEPDPAPAAAPSAANDPHFVPVREAPPRSRPRRQTPPRQNRVAAAATPQGIERAPEINFRPPVVERQQPEYTQESVPPYVPPDRRDPAERERAASIARTAPEPRAPRAVLSGPELRRRPAASAVADAPKRETDAPEPSDAQDPAGFPEVRVESVMWHPDASRRRATISIDGLRSEDVREGDLLDGLMIDRIEPGSVELRIGSNTKRVSLGS